MVILIDHEKSWSYTNVGIVLDALGCMNNADFETKIRKLQYCVRYVYCLSEITTRTINLKNTVPVVIDFQRNPPKRP